MKRYYDCEYWNYGECEMWGGGKSPNAKICNEFKEGEGERQLNLTL